MALIPSPSPPIRLSSTTTLSLTLEVAGNLDDFDEVSFKVNLAAQLASISPSDITLRITAASVRVNAIIAAPNVAVGEAALNTLVSLSSTTELLSAALGVTVTNVVAAPELISTNGAGQGVNEQRSLIPQVADQWLLAGIIIIIVFILILAAFVYFKYRHRRFCCHRCTAEKRKKSDGIDAQNVEIHVQSEAGGGQDGTSASADVETGSGEGMTSQPKPVREPSQGEEGSGVAAITAQEPKLVRLDGEARPLQVNPWQANGGAPKQWGVLLQTSNPATLMTHA